MKRNEGAAGVDAQTIAAVEEQGVDRFLEEIQAVLREGEYRPQAVSRRYIPKADGKKRPLRDRVVQAAAKLVLEPVFEADFRECSHGFRPGRGPTGALETLRKLGALGGNHVLDADVRDYFGSIDHELLRAFQVERKGRNLRAGEAEGWTRDFFVNCHGLPSPAWNGEVPGGCVMSSSERPLVSRVPENGTHGLKGGLARCLRFAAQERS